MSQPDVSVVIPTRGGATLSEAVASVLSQQGVSVEVIVVHNGDGAVPVFADERVRLLSSPAELRGNGARAVGVAAAEGRYIALLDDDDMWLPRKLSAQVALLERSGQSTARVIVGCWVREINEQASVTLVGPPVEGTIANVRRYLFERRGLRPPRPQLQTSTLLGSATTIASIPFDPARGYHQDWSWVLDQADAGTSFVVLGEALVERRIVAGGSVSKGIQAEQSLRWCAEYLSGRREIGDFILVMALPKAVRADDPKMVRRCLSEAVRRGAPGPFAWAFAARELGRMARRAIRTEERKGRG